MDQISSGDLIIAKSYKFVGLVLGFFNFFFIMVVSTWSVLLVLLSIHSSNVQSSGLFSNEKNYMKHFDIIQAFKMTFFQLPFYKTNVTKFGTMLHLSHPCSSTHRQKKKLITNNWNEMIENAFNKFTISKIRTNCATNGQC